VSRHWQQNNFALLTPRCKKSAHNNWSFIMCKKISGDTQTLVSVAFASANDACMWQSMKDNAHSSRIANVAGKEIAYHVNRAQRIANELIERMTRNARYN
jgi:hypothetical protein